MNTAEPKRRPGRRVNIDPAKLRARRQLVPLTVEELAEKAGRSSSLISALENGTSGGSPQTAHALAMALGCDVRDLLA